MLIHSFFRPKVQMPFFSPNAFPFFCILGFLTHIPKRRGKWFTIQEGL